MTHKSRIQERYLLQYTPYPFFYEIVIFSVINKKKYDGHRIIDTNTEHLNPRWDLNLISCDKKHHLANAMITSNYCPSLSECTVHALVSVSTWQQTARRDSKAFTKTFHQALRSSDIAEGMQCVVRISKVVALAVLVFSTTTCKTYNFRKELPNNKILGKLQ